MPEHLEEIKIDTDTDLEGWEEQHNNDYADSRARPERLEKCVALGQQTALMRQREIIVTKGFQHVRCR